MDSIPLRQTDDVTIILQLPASVSMEMLPMAFKGCYAMRPDGFSPVL